MLLGSSCCDQLGKAETSQCLDMHVGAISCNHEQQALASFDVSNSERDHLPF